MEEPELPPGQSKDTAEPSSRLARVLTLGKKYWYVEVGLLVILLTVLFVARWWLGSLENEVVLEDKTAAIKTACYEQIKLQFDAEQANYPLLARDGENFLTNAAKGLPLGLLLFGQRSSYSTEEKTTEELVREARQHDIRLAQLVVDLYQCYERHLADNADLLAGVRIDSILAQEQLQTAEQFDYNTLFITDELAESVITLAPKEVKNLRLRTLCIDRLAKPPNSGEKYILGGSVGETRRQDLCTLLRQAQNTSDLGQVQGSVWALEDQRMDQNGTTVEPAAGATMLHEAQAAGNVFVRASSTGAITGLDVTIANHTDRELTLDTSCAYFVPFAVPDLSKPLPEPVIDYSDPAVIQEQVEESQRRLEESQRKIQELQEQAGVIVPGVRGVFDSVLVPTEFSDEEIQQLDPVQVIQTGAGSQPLGSVGAMRGRRSFPSFPPWDLDTRIVMRETRARSTLERAWERWQQNSSTETMEQFLDAWERCFVLGCAPVDQLLRYHELVQFAATDIVEGALDRMHERFSGETMEDVIDSLRWCNAVGCDPGDSYTELDAFLRSELAAQQARDRQFQDY